MSQTICIASFSWKLLIGDVWSQNCFYDNWFKSRGHKKFVKTQFLISPSKLSNFALLLSVTNVTSTITVSKSLRKSVSAKKIFLRKGINVDIYFQNEELRTRTFPIFTVRNVTPIWGETIDNEIEIFSEHEKVYINLLFSKVFKTK